MASDSTGRTTVYHLTDDPRFKLDKTFEPQDNSLSINPRDGRKGLYVGEPEVWAGPPYGYKRPYVVELSMPSGTKEKGRWGGENFIPAESFDDVKVDRVMPYDHYVRRKYGVPGDTEDYLKKTYDTDEPLERTPGRGMARYPETIDVKKEIDTRYPQQWSDEDHKKYLKNRRDFLHDSYGWGWNEFDDEGGWRSPEDDEYDDNGELIRRDREGNRMTVDKTGAVHPIKPWAPWADLMGLSPEQSAFQRTHPDVRQKALTDLLQNGHLGRYNHLINIHRAQSMVDRVRAQQGRPSPYTHPSQPQPWHGGNWAQHPQGTTMMMNRISAVVAHPNPYHGNPDFGGNPDFSHTWFHGTRGEPDFGERISDLERIALPPEERVKGMGWAQPNKYLGVHLSPLHEVGHKFAGSVSSTPSAIVHARLDFSNPAHFPTEKHLNYAVADWASKNFPEWHNDKLNDHLGWNYSDQEGTHRDFSQVPEGYGDKAQDILQWHPYLPEIVRGFQDYLGNQGHRGITYGNEVEGPYSTNATMGGDETQKYIGATKDWPRNTPYHISAIAQPEDIHVTNVEKIAPWQAEPEGDQVTWDQAGALDEPEEMRDKILGYHRENGGAYPRQAMSHTAASDNPEAGLKAAGIAVIAMDTGRVLMLQRALNPLTCPCGQGVTWDEQNGYQHDDGSVDHDDEYAGQSVSDLLDQGHDDEGLTAEAALEYDKLGFDAFWGSPLAIHRTATNEATSSPAGLDLGGFSSVEMTSDATGLPGIDSGWSNSEQHIASASLDGKMTQADTRSVIASADALGGVAGVVDSVSLGDRTIDSKVDPAVEILQSSIKLGSAVAGSASGTGELEALSNRRDLASDSGWEQSKSVGVVHGGIVPPGLTHTAALDYDINEGRWEFPGGCLDEGEAPRDAAVREFREEVGQDLPPGVFVGAWLSPGGIATTASVGSSKGLTAIAVQPGQETFGYGSGHTAPVHSEGMKDTLDNMDDIMPDYLEHRDWYGNGDGSLGEYEAHKKAQMARGNPDKQVWIYRAVPHGIHKIYGRTEMAQMLPDHNPEDLAEWVSTSKDYAQQHAKAESCPKCGGNLQVIAGKARAGDLVNEGYPTEFGYVGEKTLDHAGTNRIYKTKCPKPRRVPKTSEQLEAEYDVVKHQGLEAVEKWEKDNEADRMLRLRPRRRSRYSSVTASDMSVPPQLDTDWLSTRGYDLGWRPENTEDRAASSLWSRELPGGTRHIMNWSPARQSWGGYVQAPTGELLPGKVRAWTSARDAHHGLSATGWSGKLRQEHRQNQTPESFQGYSPHQTVQHLPSDASDFAVKHDLFQRLNSAQHPDRVLKPSEIVHAFGGFSSNGQAGAACGTVGAQKTTANNDRVTCRRCISFGYGKPEQSGLRRPQKQSGFFDDAYDFEAPPAHVKALTDAGWKLRGEGESRAQPDLTKISPTTGVEHTLYWDRNGSGKWLYGARARDGEHGGHWAINPLDPRKEPTSDYLSLSDPGEIAKEMKKSERDYLLGSDMGEPGIAQQFNDRSTFEDRYGDEGVNPARPHYTPDSLVMPKDQAEERYRFRPVHEVDKWYEFNPAPPGQPGIQGLHYDFSDEWKGHNPHGGIEKLNSMIRLAAESPTGDQIDFIMHGWQPAYEDKTNAFEKHHGGYWHLATYEPHEDSPTGYFWRLNSFTKGGDLISDPEHGDDGDTFHLDVDALNDQAAGREYQWARQGLDSSEFKPPMSQQKPIIYPSEEDLHRARGEERIKGSVPLEYAKMDPEYELHHLQRLNNYAPGDPAMPVIPGAEAAPGVQTSYQDPRQPGADQMQYDPISGACLDRGGDTQVRTAGEKDDWFRWQPGAAHPETTWKPGFGLENWPQESARIPSDRDINTGVTQPMMKLKDDTEDDDWADSGGAYHHREDPEICQECYDADGVSFGKRLHKNYGGIFAHDFVPLEPGPGERRFAAVKDRWWRWEPGAEPQGAWRPEFNHERWPEESARVPTLGDITTGVTQPMMTTKDDDPENSIEAHYYQETNPPCATCYDRGGFSMIKGEHKSPRFDHPYKPLLPEPGERRLGAVAPVYKGFIYLIQSEKEIDLGAREIANPDDPDGDMSEQCVWWDIEHAKENPALRPEVATGTPWEELELWADKSVRTNKQVLSVVQKLADARPPLPNGLEYIDREDRPWRNLTDDEGTTNFWRWRDPELVPPKNPHDQWNFSTSHGNSVDPQPMMMLKDQIPPPGQFHDESMTTLWNEPRCETCYLQRGFPIRESEHPETKGHLFKPMLPDFDERGNLRQASRDPYLDERFSEEPQPAVESLVKHPNKDFGLVRTKDPSFPSHINPAMDAMIELKPGPDRDPGAPWWIYHSDEGRPCEQCWLRDKSQSLHYPSHFEIHGHTPMEMPRYVAAYDEYGNWYDHPSDAQVEGGEEETPFVYHNPKSGRPGSEAAINDFNADKAEVEGQVADLKQKYKDNPFTAPTSDVRDKQLRLLGPGWDYSEENNGNAYSATRKEDNLIHYVTVPNPVWRGGPNNHEAVYHHTIFHPTGEVARRYVGDANRVFDVAEGNHPSGPDDSELFPEKNPGLNDINRDKQLRQLGPGWDYIKNQYGLANSAYKNVGGSSHHVEARRPNSSGEIGYHHKIVRPNGEVTHKYVHDINGVFDVSEGKHPSVDNGEQYRDSSAERSNEWLVGLRGHRASERQRILDNLKFDPERHISFPDAEGKDVRRSPQWEMFDSSIYKPKDFKGSSIQGYKHWSGNGDFTWQHYALPIGRATKDPETGNRSIVLASEGRDWSQGGHFGPSTSKITNHLFDTLRRRGHHVQWDDEVLPSESDEKAFKKAGFERDGADYVRTAEGKRGNIVHHRIVPIMRGRAGGYYRIETYLNGIPKSVRNSGTLRGGHNSFDAESAIKETKARHRRYASVEDKRPPLPSNTLRYIDPSNEPYQPFEDTNDKHEFWRYRDTELVPPLDEVNRDAPAFGWNERHPRSVDVQPMIITKPQTDYADEVDFDRALRGPKTNVKWDDPICETCYLRYGNTVPVGTHTRAMTVYRNELDQEPHEFKPMLPDRDEKGNLRESAVRINDLEGERRQVVRNPRTDPEEMRTSTKPVIWNIGGDRYLEKVNSPTHAHNEFLASLVGRALGADVSKVMLTPRKDTDLKDLGNIRSTTLTKVEPGYQDHGDMNHKEGDLYLNHVVNSPRGARIGLLDTLVNVSDHTGTNNGMKPDSSEPSGYAPHSIDYESAFFDLRSPNWFGGTPYTRHFIGDFDFQPKQNPLTNRDVVRGRTALESLHPVFKALGREGDHDAMMKRWDAIEKNAGGGEGPDILPENLPSLSLLTKDSQPHTMGRQLPNGSVVHAFDTGRGRWVHQVFSPVKHNYPMAAARHHEVALENGGDWQQLGYQLGYPRAMMGGPPHTSSVKAQGEAGRINKPRAGSYGEIRDLIKEHRPELTVRMLDEMPMEHHDAILSAERPNLHEDPDVTQPRIYAVRAHAPHSTFLAPVYHNETGEDGWLRGSTKTDPASWTLYPEHDLSNAIIGNPAGKGVKRPRNPRMPSGAPPVEGDVPLDEHGHQQIEPWNDLFSELGKQRGFSEDEPDWHDLNWAEESEKKHNQESFRRPEWWSVPA